MDCIRYSKVVMFVREHLDENINHIQNRRDLFFNKIHSTLEQIFENNYPLNKNKVYSINLYIFYNYENLLLRKLTLE